MQGSPCGWLAAGCRAAVAIPPSTLNPKKRLEGRGLSCGEAPLTAVIGSCSHVHGQLQLTMRLHPPGDRIASPELVIDASHRLIDEVECGRLACHW